MKLNHPKIRPILLLTLVLSGSLAAALFTLVYDIALRPAPFVDNPSQLFVVSNTDDWLPGLASASSLHSNTVTATVSFYATAKQTLESDDDSQAILVEFIGPNFFKTLGGNTWAVGPQDAENHMSSNRIPGCVISYDLWRDVFAADPNVIGRSVWIGRTLYSIVSVTRKGFNSIEKRRIDAWAPFEYAPDQLKTKRETNRQNQSLFVAFVRLRDLENFHEFQKEFNEKYGNPSHTQSPAVQLIKLADWLRPTPNRKKQYVLICYVAGVLMLLGSVNGVLLLRRDVYRSLPFHTPIVPNHGSREILQSIFRFPCLTVSAALSILCAGWVQRGIASLVISSDIFVGYTVDPLITVIELLFLSALFYLLAILATSLDKTNRANGDPQVSVFCFSEAKVAHIFYLLGVAAVCVTALFATLFARSYFNARKLDLGFSPEELLIATPDFEIHSDFHIRSTIAASTAEYAAIINDLQSIPEVSVVAATSPVWTAANYVTVRMPTGSQSSEQITGAAREIVSPKYLETIGARILTGRFFLDSDTRGKPPVIVVNHAFAIAFWSDEDAIGQCILVSKSVGCSTIVGVVEDINREIPLHQTFENKRFYIPLQQSSELALLSDHFSFVIRASSPLATALPTISSSLNRLTHTSGHMHLIQVESVLTEQIEQWRRPAIGLAILSFILLFLVITGISELSMLQEMQKQSKRIHDLKDGDTRVVALSYYWNIYLMPIAGGLLLAVIIARLTTPMVANNLFLVSAQSSLNQAGTFGLVGLFLVGFSALKRKHQRRIST